jgi:hypothetical protein
MNQMPRPAADAIVELYEWSRAARDLFVRSHQPHDSPGMRALKNYLAERHATHLRDLRQMLHELGQGPSLSAQSYSKHRLDSATTPSALCSRPPGR